MHFCCLIHRLPHLLQLSCCSISRFSSSRSFTCSPSPPTSQSAVLPLKIASSTLWMLVCWLSFYLAAAPEASAEADYPPVHQPLQTPAANSPALAAHSKNGTLQLPSCRESEFGLSCQRLHVQCTGTVLYTLLQHVFLDMQASETLCTGFSSKCMCVQTGPDLHSVFCHAYSLPAQICALLWSLVLQCLSSRH